MYNATVARHCCTYSLTK